jgi:hypothetical protein
MYSTSVRRFESINNNYISSDGVDGYIFYSSA